MCNAYGVNRRLRMHPRVRRYAATLGWIIKRLRRRYVRRVLVKPSDHDARHAQPPAKLGAAFGVPKLRGELVIAIPTTAQPPAIRPPAATSVHRPVQPPGE
jgi:hypothetical protein